MSAPPSRVLRALASASTALLAQPLSAQDNAWQSTAAALAFTEFEKVSGTEVLLSGRTALSPLTDLTLGAVLDVLVGASPNGATPSAAAQTFTTPSGFDTYRAAPREEPLDGSFQDNRMELSALWDRRHGRTVTASYGTRASMEFDYMSVGVESRLAVDSDSRDTTWTAGFGASHDRVHPVGGIPRELAAVAPADSPQPRVNAALTKNVFDLLLGVSQVLGRRTVAQLNYTQTYSEGYHTDPYKIVSVVDAASGATVGYLHERRPGERAVHGVFGRIKHRFDDAILDLGLRLTDDDWDLRTSTLDVRWRRRGDGAYWEPHLRWYRQSAAAFYRHSISNAEALNDDLSADRRLAEFDALTIGVRYGSGDASTGFSLSVEYYQQFGDESPSDAIGEQRGLDLFPETRAILVQFSNLFVW